MYPLSYHSRGYRGAERCYSISECEALAVSDSVDHFNPYLRLGKKIHLWSDNAVTFFALKQLEKMQFTSSRVLNRLLVALDGLNFVCHYKKSSVIPSDWLTRATKCEPGKEPALIDEPACRHINKPCPILPVLNEDGSIKIPVDWKEEEQINVGKAYSNLEKNMTLQ